MKKMIGAGFTNGKGTVHFEDGTSQDMTYEQYIVMKRNFQYSSIAQLIRYLENKGAFWSAGHRRSIRSVTVFEQRLEIFDLWSDDCMTKDEHKKVAKLLLRYQRFYRYCTETALEWKEVDRIHWADNSIDSIQVNKHGEQRRIMVTGPHGDACY